MSPKTIDPARVKAILFDAMETLVDVSPLPTENDRASWAWKGLPSSRGWESFDAFAQSHYRCGQSLRNMRGEREYELRERFALMIEECPQAAPGAMEAMYENYCREYYQRCTVSDRTKSSLSALRSKLPLGIVSNHIIRGALQHIMKKESIYSCFDPTVVSIDLGWKKPGKRIYRFARDKLNIPFENILFVGDDILHDYEQPRELGMQAILYDPAGQNPTCPHRISSFRELCDLFG